MRIESSGLFLTVGSKYKVKKGYQSIMVAQQDRNNNNKQTNKTLVPKFWGQLWILNILVKVGQMYSLPSFYYNLMSIP